MCDKLVTRAVSTKDLEVNLMFIGPCVMVIVEE